MAGNLTTHTALLCLARAGYNIYYPVVQEQPCFIIESPDKTLSRAILRRASPSSNSPILTLSRLQQSATLLSQVEYLLVVCVETEQAWILPTHLIPTDRKTIRLGQNFAPYLLHNLTTITQLAPALVRRRFEQLTDSHDNTELTDILQENDHAQSTQEHLAGPGVYEASAGNGDPSPLPM